MSKSIMNKTLPLLMVVAVSLFCSCQKQQSEEERNAEVARQVQERLAAEHQTQQQQEIEKRQTDLDAREKALAEKENAAAQPSPVQSSQPSDSEETESGQRYETEETESGAERPTASYSTFYNQLEPYGAWLETDNYGYVWQPYQAERSQGWRPYTNGHWAYTDLGWMWISEEPFGWAAYHYGRWTRLSHIGWVWVPGEQWAPAWVSWRKSNDYVGWAPLPPEARFDRRSGIHNWADNYYDIGPDQYSFVPVREFGAQRVAPVIVSPERNVNIVNETTNVTNITYNNTTIVNQGPDYEDLRTHSQSRIERLRVERETRQGIEVEQPHAIVQGEVIKVPAPVIAHFRPADRPKRIRRKVSQTSVDRGWEGITDSKAVERARAKIKSEATPPPNAPPKKYLKPAQLPPAGSPAARPTSSPITASPVRSPLPTQQPRFKRIATPKPAAAVTSPTPVRPQSTAPLLPSATPVSTPSERPSFTPRLTATPIPTLPVTSPTQIPAIRPGPQQPVPRHEKNPPQTQTSATPTFSSPEPSPGHPDSGQKPQKRAEKNEKKQEKKERKQRGKQNPSATPTP